MITSSNLFLPRLVSHFGKLSLYSFRRCFFTSKPIQQKWSTASRAMINRIAGATVHADKLKIQWENGHQNEYHNVWLRDHCQCAKCYSQELHRRELNLLNMPLDIKPEKAASISEGHQLHLTWPDGHNTVYDANWLHNHAYKTENETRKERLVEQFIWNRHRLNTIKLPQKQFKSVIQDDKSCFELSHDIKRFGFALVNETPSTSSAIEDLAERLAGFVRVTAIAGVWEFSSGLARPDNEALDYTTDKIEAHTDTSFYSDPAGLTILQCAQQEGTGGENFLIDGFNVAEMLKAQDIDAFKFLTSKKVPFQMKSKTGYHLNAEGHVIEVDPYWKNVRKIRFSSYAMDVLDRLDAEDVPKFYQAIQAMLRIIYNYENAFWLHLEPNVCLIMDNWRIIHGQNAFTGARRLLGCHCSKDDFESRFRYNYDRFLLHR